MLQRPLLRFVAGPRRFSFARIAEQWGEASVNCKDSFRFTLPQLRVLLVELRIPERFRTRSGSWTAEEGLLLLLYRLSRPNTWNRIAWEAGRQPSHLCECFIYMCQHIMGNFRHLIDSRSIEAWAPHFPRFAAALHAKTGPGTLTNCVLLYDVKIQATTKPGKEESRFYNGFPRAHGLKWLEVALPNGILPLPFGPVNSCEADPTVFTRSGLRRAIIRASLS